MCPYPEGPCTGPGTEGGPNCDHAYLPTSGEQINMETAVRNVLAVFPAAEVVA